MQRRTGTTRGRVLHPPRPAESLITWLLLATPGLCFALEEQREHVKASHRCLAFAMWHTSCRSKCGAKQEGPFPSRAPVDCAGFTARVGRRSLWNHFTAPPQALQLADGSCAGSNNSERRTSHDERPHSPLRTNPSRVVNRGTVALLHVPSAAVLPSLLQNGQVAALCCQGARFLVPRAAVLPSPLQHCQVAVARCP